MIKILVNPKAPKFASAKFQMKSFVQVIHIIRRLHSEDLDEAAHSTILIFLRFLQHKKSIIKPSLECLSYYNVLKKAKMVYNFGLSEYNKVKRY